MVGVAVGVGVGVVVVVGVAVAVRVVVAVGVGVGVVVGVAVGVGVRVAVAVVAVVGVAVAVGVGVIHSLVGPLPRHLYVYVDTTFTGRETGQLCRFAPAVWFGLTSTPGRMWGCTVLLESGAVYRSLPPHALAFSMHPDEPWTAQDAQTWDCYSTDCSTLEYPYLSGLRCLAKTGPTMTEGRYLFSVAPVGDGFSAQPEQAKEFHFIQLENGRLTVQPTDRVVYEEKSFTSGPLAFPHGLRAQTEVYRCE